MSESWQVVIVSAAAFGSLGMLVRAYWPRRNRQGAAPSAACPKCPSAAAHQAAARTSQARGPSIRH